MIVVDCSVLISGLLPDELDEESDTLFNNLETVVTVAVVPSLFFQEITNVLLTAYRRKRISYDSMYRYIDVINSLPIITDTNAAVQGDIMKLVCNLADQHGLTTYDACYLELALRRNLTLVTLDIDLRRVAIELNILYKPPF